MTEVICRSPLTRIAVSASQQVVPLTRTVVSKHDEERLPVAEVPDSEGAQEGGGSHYGAVREHQR